MKSSHTRRTVAELRTQEVNKDMENNNKDLINDLKAFVEYLESRPELPEIGSGNFPIFAWDSEKFADAVRKVGSGVKVINDYSAQFERKFGNIRLYVYTSRNTVCKEVQVGTKTVQSFEIKPEFKDMEIGGWTEKEEPVYEWQCLDSWMTEKS